MNFEEETMDDWCQVHNAHYSEKTCQEFINMYNVFFVPTTECKKGKSEKEKVEEEVEEEYQYGEEAKETKEEVHSKTVNLYWDFIQSSDMKKNLRNKCVKMIII